MSTVILRRLLTLVPIFLVVSMGIFAISLQLDPAKAAQIRAGGVDASSVEVIESVEEELGLNDPVIVRYGRWLRDAVQFDLGRSLTRVVAVDSADGGTEFQGRPVLGEIGKALPRTLSIALVGAIWGISLGVLVGIVGGLRPGSLLDRISVLFGTVGLAVPSFWLIMLLVLWFSVGRGWLPATGYTPLDAGVWPWLRHLLLPGIAVGTVMSAIVSRQLRAALMDVMGSAYVRTAWAKGASAVRVVGKHSLRNAANAPLTVMGNQFAHLISGTIVIEILVGVQGVGQLVVTAVRSNDITMLQGLVLFFVLVTVLINLVVDLLYSYMNPKMRIT